MCKKHKKKKSKITLYDPTNKESKLELRFLNGEFKITHILKTKTKTVLNSLTPNS